MQHELKIWPQYYDRVANGSKTFEVRNNDRGFQKGDTVILREYLPDAMDHLGDIRPKFSESDPLVFEIGYVLPIDSERVVFSLLPVAPVGMEKV